MDMSVIAAGLMALTAIKEKLSISYITKEDAILNMRLDALEYAISGALAHIYIQRDGSVKFIEQQRDILKNSLAKASSRDRPYLAAFNNTIDRVLVITLDRMETSNMYKELEVKSSSCS